MPDIMALVTHSQVVEAIAGKVHPTATPFYSDSFRIGLVRQALDFLHSKGVSRVSRWDEPKTLFGRSIYECYSPRDLKKNLVAMVEGALVDYAEFVGLNRFGRFSSDTISGNLATVLVLSEFEFDSGVPSGAVVYEISNEDRKLPSFLVVDLEEESEKVEIGQGKISIFGREYFPKRSWSPLIDQVLDERPIQAGIYRLLESDLEMKFGVRLR